MHQDNLEQRNLQPTISPPLLLRTLLLRTPHSLQVRLENLLHHGRFRPGLQANEEPRAVQTGKTQAAHKILRSKPAN